MKLKKVFFLSISVLMIALLYSCKGGKKIISTPTPYTLTALNLPNCLKVNDSLYVDKSEITNIDYKEFMYFKGLEYSKSSQTFLSLYPEMTGYLKAIPTHSSSRIDIIWNESYHFDPPYDAYPVVGVTLAQAKKYSKWRSKTVFEMLLIEQGYMTVKESINHRDRKLTLNDIVLKISKDPRFDAITHYPLYYIPDSNEWNLVYEKCLNGEIKMDQLNHKGSALKHQKITGLPLSPSQGFDTLKQENILYHFIGNTSELIANEGFTAGGNYFQDQKELLKSSNIRREATPSATVSYRNFCKWVKIER